MINDALPKMKWFDVSLIKLSTAAAVLLIAKYWTLLTSFDWYWYVIVAILASIRPLKVMLS